MYIAYREFAVLDGKDVLCNGEARYTFTVSPGRNAVTWANAAHSFAPAEYPSVDVSEVAVRLHKSHKWRTVDGFAADMLISEVPDAWFLAQIEDEV